MFVLGCLDKWFSFRLKIDFSTSCIFYLNDGAFRILWKS